MLDDALTRRIQQAFDISEVVGEHVKLAKAGKDFKGLCPFHQEKTPSFYVVPAKQIFKCFGCGAGGDVFKFIQLRERVGFPEARAILAAKAGIPLQERAGRSSGGDSDKSELARVNDWAMRWFAKQFAGSNGAAARDYAARRGLSAESIDAFGIGFAPDSWDALMSGARSANVPLRLLVAAGLVKPRPTDGGHYDAFRNRLMFPIRDPMQRVIGFGGRTLGDDPAKYLNTSQTPLFDKARCLFGLDVAKNAIGTTGRAIVVEGYLDCVMAHQFGFNDTIATLGTALGTDHAAILRRYTESVVLLLDSDQAGERAVDRALPLFLSQRLDVRLARVPEGKDPADYLLAKGREGLEAVLNSASDALESKWQQLTARYRGAVGVSGRRQAVEDFLGVLASAMGSESFDPIQRGLIVNQVAKLLGLSADDIHRKLGLVTARTAKPAAGERPVRVVSVESPDAEAVATRELLEVVLNEPSYHATIGAAFDAELLGDDQLRRIGRYVLESLNRSGEQEVHELLAGIESVEDAQRVVDLQMAGQRRGNFAATVDGAVARIYQVRNRRYADALRDTLRLPEQATPDSDSDALARVEMARQHRHFAARKHLGRVDGRAGEVVQSPGSKPAVG